MQELVHYILLGNDLLPDNTHHYKTGAQRPFIPNSTLQIPHSIRYLKIHYNSFNILKPEANFCIIVN